MSLHHAYTWYQDNTSVTVDIYVPVGTTPSQLQLLLTKRRVKLLDAADRAIFLRRRTFAAIEPRCTEGYTMPAALQDASRAIVRVVLYKAVPAGWLSLFVGDAPEEAFMAQPSPMSHALIRQAAEAKIRDLAAQDAKRAFEAAYHAAHSGLSHQTWRARGKLEGPQVKRAGGRLVRLKVSGAVFSAGVQAPTAGVVQAASEPCSEGRHAGTAQHAWRPAKRWTPLPVTQEVRIPPGAEGAAGANHFDPNSGGSDESESGGDGGGGGNGGGGGGGDDDSDSDSDGGTEPFDANEEVEYPLPGSEASCDGCGALGRRYYHCVQCGMIDGFDLCLKCYRSSVHNAQHERRYPTHKLKLVTPHTAPLMPKKPTLKQAPPAPPPPRPLPGGTVSARVNIPFEAKVKHSWTQHLGEIYLSVELPRGTRARDLIVVIEPFKVSVSLRGAGVILRGSFHKGVRHRESFWTIEEGELKVLLQKSDTTSWKKLFPEEEELHPMQAIKQICDDTDPLEHSYMDLNPEARGLVDLHRSYRHAKATGDENYAAELEEEMKMMRFNWGGAS